MEIKKPRKNPAKIIAISVISVAVVALAGYTTYAYMAKTWPFGDESATEATPDDVNTTTPEMNGSSTTTTPPSADQQDKTPVKYSPPADGDDTTSPSDAIDGTINYASVVDGTLRIRTTIPDMLGSGTCVLTLKHTASGASTTYTKSIVSNPSPSHVDDDGLLTMDLV